MTDWGRVIGAGLFNAGAQARNDMLRDEATEAELVRAKALAELTADIQQQNSPSGWVNKRTGKPILQRELESVPASERISQRVYELQHEKDKVGAQFEASAPLREYQEGLTADEREYQEGQSAIEREHDITLKKMDQQIYREMYPNGRGGRAKQMADIEAKVVSAYNEDFSKPKDQTIEEWAREKMPTAHSLLYGGGGQNPNSSLLFELLQGEGGGDDAPPQKDQSPKGQQPEAAPNQKNQPPEKKTDGKPSLWSKEFWNAPAEEGLGMAKEAAGEAMKKTGKAMMQGGGQDVFNEKPTQKAIEYKAEYNRLKSKEERERFIEMLRERKVPEEVIQWVTK